MEEGMQKAGLGSLARRSSFSSNYPGKKMTRPCVLAAGVQSFSPNKRKEQDRLFAVCLFAESVVWQKRAV